MLLQQFQQHLKQKFSYLTTVNCKLLLAVSGGIDSVIMTDLFYKSGYDFAIAHCNFQLREEESVRDEVFVRTLAVTCKKEIFVKRFNTKLFAEEHKISIQEAARKLRYDWFNEIINKWKTPNEEVTTVNPQPSSINYIVTAHNADDNIETSLMFFLRGTGIHGLTGINQFDKERKIIRPLLFATRQEIEKYANENGISWVEDSSNATDKYTRNFLRNNFIPSVTKHLPSVKKNLSENINRFKEVEIIYKEAIESYKKKLLEYKGNEVHIPVLKLQKIKSLQTLLWEIIKDYNFQSNQIEEVKKLFVADNSSYVQSISHKIIRNRNWLIIAPHEAKILDFILIYENDKKVEFKNGCLQTEVLSADGYELTTKSFTAQLDYNLIQFPLILRKWKQGDYFYPLGMKKKKKLSRFFIDQKLSATQKENIWVLEMNKKLIWIIGYRIDDRFKITKVTEKVLVSNLISFKNMIS